MGYDVRYEDMYLQQEIYDKNLCRREEQLVEIRNCLRNICSMTEMTGAMADSVRAYIQELHLPLIEWMLNLIGTYRTNLTLYMDYYCRLDSDRMARFGQDCIEDQQQKLMYEKEAFQEIADNIQGILWEVSGYMDIDGFDPSGVEMAYDAAIAYADNVRNTIGENEAVHQAYDMESVNTMLDCIMPILEEQLGGQAGALETYQSGSIFDRTEYQSAITMSIGMQDYITQKQEQVTACKAFAYEQKKQWDEMLYHRETEAALQVMEALGIGIMVTVAAVTTAIAAVPMVFGLYGTTTGIVVTGTTATVYAGAYTYQGSKVIEGMNSYRLAQEGDATGIAVNPIRDTIFASNPELYYNLGEISTTVSLAVPSIAGSMSTAVRLGVSPTRAALTEMGMLGGSDMAGRYVQAGVYEETGDLRLANMARSGTSLLVYGGLAYADARMGMSGIRQWRTPKVNPLEFQPPEQASCSEILGPGNLDGDINSGLTQSQIEDIVSIPKGSRPDPSTYLSQEYIDAHLSQFDDGASIVMTKEQYINYIKGNPTIGIPTDGTQFVLPKNYCDDIASNAAGDISYYEKALGFDSGHFSDGGGLVRIDIDILDDLNLRIPSGNEAGANSHWIPGGKTDGGVPEAVTDLIPNVPDNITVSEIK